jgi:hypothetical protein
MKGLKVKIFVISLLSANAFVLNRQVTVQNEYQSQNFFSIKERGKTGFINNKGITIIPTHFKSAGSFNNNLAKALKDSLWGYINMDGSFIIKPQFTIANDFSEGLAEVWINNKHCFIDTLGNIMFETSFRNTGKFYSGMSRVYSNEGYTKGFINSKGELVIKPIYLYAEDFSEGMTNVADKFLDKRGNTILQSSGYKINKGFSEGLAQVNLNNEIPAYINSKGKVVINLKNLHVTSAYSFSDGMAVVSRSDEDHKSGYINKNGRLTIPFLYVEAHGFSEGLASVKKDIDGRWGYINKRGECVIKQRFTEVPFDGFKNGLAYVKENGKWGYINKEGEYMWQENSIK